MRRTVVLVHLVDGRDVMYRALHLDDDGSMTIEGHDLGGAVEETFGDGNREYEFTRTIDARAVEILRDSLGLGPGPIVDLLSRWSSADLDATITRLGLPSTFWSRAGD